MKEIFTMWKNTRMVILVALVAAVYAAILIPFKAIPLIPGITELRPGNVCPVIFSLMFGPAAAWGAAIGDIVADSFGGTLTMGSIGGFVGNFFMGLIPYVIWGRLGFLSSGDKPFMKSRKQITEYVFVAIIASIGCGAIIGWGLEVFKLFPFAVLGNIISLNNAVAAILLGPFLLRILYPRMERWGLLWEDIMKDSERSQPTWVRSSLMIVASLGTYVTGNIFSIFLYKSKAFGAGFAQAGDLNVVGQVGVVGGLAPFILLFFITLLTPGRTKMELKSGRATSV